jgi:hypothetical protein
MFWLLHLGALLAAPILLLMTVPMHWLYGDRVRRD